MAECMTDQFPVSARHYLGGDEAIAYFPAGQTIAEALGEHCADTVIVRVGGHDVPRSLWRHVRPRPGIPVHAVIGLQGGNGGKYLKLAIVAVISYFTFGAGAAGAAAWLGVGTTTLEVIGAVAILATNALIPPPTPKLGGAGSDPFQQLQSITGTSNQAAPYQVVPCVVGTIQMFPPHAALPYTEISGNDQYLRMLLDLGYGDLDISDIEIGGTPIASYTDVEYEISTSPSLFTQDIYEAAVGTALNTNGANDTRTTQLASTEISLDIIFGQGLFSIDSKGNTQSGTVHFTVQYRAVGDVTWIDAGTASGLTLTNGFAYASGTFTISSSAKKTLRAGIRWKVSSGQYEVLVTRGTSSYGSSSAQIGDATWSVLRSISPQNPSTTGTLKLAVRIKATDQLNGVVSNLSVLAAQKIPTYNTSTSTWSADAANTNPAWIAAWLMTRCPAVVRQLADARLDLQAFSDWADECTAKGYSIGFVMDSARALGDVLNDVFAAGRASRGMRNGLYAPIRDVSQSTPIQMFTPANSWGFEYARAFADLPHALKVTFTNTQANYQQDVMIVYADGYNSDGSGGLTAATRFESLDLRQVIDPDAVWRLARYHLSVMYNRPTTYTLNVDIEHMVCERGDMVHVAHDVIGWGITWGRINAVSGSTVTLDGEVTLEAGKTYAIRVRRADNSQVTETITSSAGTYETLTLATALASGDVGNVFIVGEVNKTIVQLLVKSIQPNADDSAKLAFVDYSTDVLNSDSGTPPTFVSSINGKPWCEAPDAPIVSIRADSSAPDDAGVINATAGISSAPPSGIHRIPIWGKFGPGYTPSI